jgi:hypothetical protein
VSWKLEGAGKAGGSGGAKKSAGAYLNAWLQLRFRMGTGWQYGGRWGESRMRTGTAVDSFTVPASRKT